MSLGKIYPGAVKPGKIKITFESEDGKKKATILFEHKKEENEMVLNWLHPDPETIGKDRHETYMFQALAFYGSFHPEK